MRVKAITKCLFTMSDTERTPEVVICRLKGIKDEMRRAAGALKAVNEARMRRDPVYNARTVEGWAEHINTLAEELTLAYSLLASSLLS